ncbi:MAG: hypothetical protein IPL06_08985 [Betaproteobacteria bacterium]|nr:hypothetical protein [Betaproteobacteria bacterium]
MGSGLSFYVVLFVASSGWWRGRGHFEGRAESAGRIFTPTTSGNSFDFRQSGAPWHASDCTLTTRQVSARRRPTSCLLPHAQVEVAHFPERLAALVREMQVARDVAVLQARERPRGPLRLAADHHGGGHRRGCRRRCGSPLRADGRHVRGQFVEARIRLAREIRIAPGDGRRLASAEPLEHLPVVEILAMLDTRDLPRALPALHGRKGEDELLVLAEVVLDDDVARIVPRHGLDLAKHPGLGPRAQLVVVCDPASPQREAGLDEGSELAVHFGENPAGGGGIGLREGTAGSEQGERDESDGEDPCGAHDGDVHGGRVSLTRSFAAR